MIFLEKQKRFAPDFKFTESPSLMCCDCMLMHNVVLSYFEKFISSRDVIISVIEG